MKVKSILGKLKFYNSFGSGAGSRLYAFPKHKQHEIRHRDRLMNKARMIRFNQV